LLWGFHNSRTGACFPSCERIAEKAECARSTVAEALKVLEWADVLSWQHRITRVREACTDLFGRHGWRWRVVRTSNAYMFRDPQAALAGAPPSKSENQPGTLNQEIPISRSAPLDRSHLPTGTGPRPIRRCAGSKEPHRNMHCRAMPGLTGGRAQRGGHAARHRAELRARQGRLR
jgi:hypothetical protein